MDLGRIKNAAVTNLTRKTLLELRDTNDEYLHMFNLVDEIYEDACKTADEKVTVGEFLQNSLAYEQLTDVPLRKIITKYETISNIKKHGYALMNTLKTMSRE